MSTHTDIGTFIESWLLEDERDVLPEHVLRSVADGIAGVRQRRSPVLRFAIWRYAVVPASVAVLLVLSIAGYVALRPQPPATGSSSAASSPTSSHSPQLSPTPTAYQWLFSPVATYAEQPGHAIKGPIRVTLGRVSVQLDPSGWYPMPGPTSLALTRAIIDLEGGSLGAFELVPVLLNRGPGGSLAPDRLDATLPGDVAQFGPTSVLRLRYVDAHDPGALMEVARQEAQSLYDGHGRVEERLRLPAGPAALVRTTYTDSHGLTFQVVEYVIQLPQEVALLTFGTSRSLADISDEFRRVAESLRVVE